MAKEEKEEGKKSGKGMLIVIIAVVLVLLAGGGGAAWWFLLRPKPAADAKAAAAKAADAAKATHFVSLDQFVTNVQSQDGEAHYVQVNVDLKTDDPKADDAVKAVLPEIRSSILNTLGAQQATAVQNPAVQEKLRAVIQADVNKILADSGATAATGGGMITGVYFTGFIMQ